MSVVAERRALTDLVLDQSKSNLLLPVVKQHWAVAPWSVEGSIKDGDEVGKGIGKIGGVLYGSASDLVWESMMGGGNGSECQYPDAKSMFDAIETRFGGNATTKKTQKTLLKQQYKNFSASSWSVTTIIVGTLAGNAEPKKQESKDGDEVGKGIGKIGGVPDGSVSDLVWESMMGGGNGSEWEVDGASALSQIIEARYPNG
ncbi:hypothetical protein Tco_0006783 [Tanacetum coccineum]